MTEKTIGILGGMGPEATADLFYRIIKGKPVERDQDHARVIIYSNSKIPDRTNAILKGGPNPVPEMTMAAKALECAGADFLIMPCNTAHYFIEDLRGNIGIPVLDMIELTAQHVKNHFPKTKQVGLIATDGTVQSLIYHKKFEELGICVITPSVKLQLESMRAIYGNIKKGNLLKGRQILLAVAESLVNSGADMIICGCTEVSLVLKDGDLTVPVVDPLEVLAMKALEFSSD